ncbi:MAG: caspase family protein [Sulfuritalea sp.]|nr:caspase family protein [Sulfuritalea sp.]
MIRWRFLLVAISIVLLGLLPLTEGSAEPAKAAADGNAKKDARVAVVIGNSNYPSGKLANPRSDAAAMATALRQLGFDVDLVFDTTRTDMEGAFRRLAAKSDNAAVTAVFYAGHGIQVNGSNYLVPIDANPRSERDLKRNVVRLDDVIDDMEPARIKLVFFDACRDNPLSRSFNRGGARGLAPPVEATGTLISFATKHGNTAADGDGKHSPYTQALLAALEKPRGVEIEQLLRSVQQGVKHATNGQQEPWRYGSLDGDFYFQPGDSAADIAKAQQEAVDRAVSEAVKVANEKAAKEMADMLAVMEKKLKDALAKQNAALQAERQAWIAANASAMRLAMASKPASVIAEKPSIVAEKSAVVMEKPSAAAAPASAVPAIKIAALPPSPPTGPATVPAKVLDALGVTPGDEWDYVAKDIFGRKQQLTGRVKAVVAGTGVLEEFAVAGKPVAEWVLDGQPRLVGLPMDAIFLFAPNWNGESEDIDLLNSAACLTIDHATGCAAAWMRVAGNERITVPAGSFDTRKLEIRVLGSSDWGTATLDVTVWYADDLKRVVRQTIRGSHPMSEASVNALNETIELVAFRRAKH